MATQGKSVEWVNADGLSVGFGTRTTAVEEATVTYLGGNRYVIEQRIDCSSLSTTGNTSTSFTGGGVHPSIPAGAVIKSGELMVESAVTSGTSTADLFVGLQTAAGAEIDFDGFIGASQGDVTANLGSDGNCVAIASTLVDTVVDAESYISYKANGAALNGGTAVIRVEYILPATLLKGETLEA